MKLRRLLAAALLAAVLLSLLVAPVLAQDGGGGKLVMGGSYRVQSGETLRGDLGILGGNVTIEEGATVRGDILMAGGALDIAGQVTGDMAIFGGSVDLAATAVVNGDVMRVGGSMNTAEGAQITGDIRSDGVIGLPGIWSDGIVVPMSPPDILERSTPASPGAVLLGLFLALLRAVVLVIALGALALVVSLLWPKGIERMGQAGAGAPGTAVAVGALTWIVGLALILLMVVTICLIPFALVLGLALLAGVLLGWIVTGWWVGNKLFDLLKLSSQTVVAEVTIGTILLAVIYFLVSILPCAEFVFGALVASFGLGAVALTRFGTRPYPPVLAATPVTALPEAQSTALTEDKDRDLTQ